MISKIIGKKATRCRKCNGELHFVNKLGGICCAACSTITAKNPSVIVLRIESGVWVDDSTDRFDMTERPSASAQENENQAGGHVATKPKQTTVATTKLLRPSMTVSPWSRGIGGALSDRMADVFMSDEVWNQSDQLIVFKPRSSAPVKPQRNEWARRERSFGPPRPLPAIGSTVTTDHSVATFGETVSPGPFVIESVASDDWGDVFMNLSRAGRSVLSGVMLSEIRKN